MARVMARRALPGARVGEAEALWYALERRPTFIDGFTRADIVDGDWPRIGGRIVWGSPGASGRVVENVSAYEPGVLQAATLEDSDVRGTQTVHFHTDGEHCQIELALDYEVKREGLAGTLADAIYIRRRRRASLERTLARFAIELAAERELHS